MSIGMSFVAHGGTFKAVTDIDLGKRKQLKPNRNKSGDRCYNWMVASVIL